MIIKVIFGNFKSDGIDILLLNCNKGLWQHKGDCVPIFLSVYRKIRFVTE